MKSIKRYFLLIFISIVFFVGIDFVKASDIYNAHAGTAFNDSYKGNCRDKKNCLLINDNKIIVQARLYYIYEGSFTPIGDTIYFVNSSANNYLKNKKVNVIYLNELNYSNDYKEASKYIKKHITDISTGQSILKKITGKTNYSEILNNISKASPSLEGYRIIIEPANVYVNPTFSDKSHAIITVKGLAAEYARTKYKISCLGNPGTSEQNCENPLLGFNSQAQYLYLENWDVGIETYNKNRCAGIHYEQLADMKIGCGYDIVDVNKFIKTQICWQKNKLTNRNMTCKNTDENNVEKIVETYSSIRNCSNSISERKMYSEYGTRINGSGTCNIYCIESAQISLPGNISELKQKGSYFAWPTSPDDIFGKYSMSIKSTMKCTIKDDGTESENIGSTLTMGCTGGYTPYNSEYCRSLTDTVSMDCGSKTEVNGLCYELKDKITTTTTTYKCSQGTMADNGMCAVKTCPDYYSENPGGTGIYSCKYTTSAKYDGGCDGSCCSQNNGSMLVGADCPGAWSYCCYWAPKTYYNDKTKTIYENPVSTTTTILTCPSGYSEYSANPSKCISNEYTEKDHCKDGYVKIEGICYKKKRKSSLSFSCPSGYTISEDKTTCNKVCDKNYLIKVVENNIKNNRINEISAKLTGGTNIKIDSNLEVASDEYSFDKESLIFERLVKFKIKPNLNRYYNKITGNVSNNKINGEIIFDRQEGVISLSKNDPVYQSDKLINYPLTISKIKVGINNKFGKLLENSNYTCKYNLTEEKDDCICPSGTKNAGMVLNDIVKKYCDDIGDDCAEWKYNLCDSDYSKITKIDGCSNKFYCINPMTKKEVNITECVKNKSKNYSLEIAERMCELENEECTNDTICINPITKQIGNIKICLEEGNSRESCEIKVGCKGDSYCTGECSWITKKINNVIYGYEKCNNNRFCGFTTYCNDMFKSASTTSYDCVAQKLGVENIENALNSGMPISKLENAVNSCRSTICASKEKIVYRTIDLSNPFPGKKLSTINSGLSLTGNKSRNPGTNWNSTNLVTKEILKARGVNGYELYTKKDPLYIIKLTPEIINKIRRYNENNKYDNFKLECTTPNEDAACISDFLHKPGTIENLNPSEFILSSYENKKSVNSCYDMSYNETSFKNCYEKNN